MKAVNDNVRKTVQVAGLLDTSATPFVYGNRNRSNKSIHIAFLKVHKAGSTMMQNLLFRFGLHHNLSIAIPRKRNYIYNTSTALPPLDSTRHDILACHTVYNRTMYYELVPEDAVRIAILRDPLDLIVSAAYYYRDVINVKYLKYLLTIPRGNFIHDIINHLEDYDNNLFSRMRNSMAEDFGFRYAVNTTDAKKVQEYLNVLAKEFPMVMVMERMDESLVLMKRLLNWSIADVIYLQANANPHKMPAFSGEELAKFRNTSSVDYAIYDFFVKILDEKIKLGGTDLQSEVDYFRICLVKVKQFCGGNYETNYLEFDASDWDGGFNITTDDCRLMKTEELDFIDELRKIYAASYKKLFDFHCIFLESPFME
ncbi:hypothetical protein DPMN_145351 [Dreissena polymorpha]|uniref:Uncharacterized protein n=1 Tax=Dreissena polymorpha TaxID=45954 RepID=A0A9D4F3U1_DREPO|nr:hypothetical protein DPMN_145351 [Dreissena polymorpha]